MIFPPSTQRSRANYPLKYAGRGKLLFIKGTSLGRDQNQWSESSAESIGDAQTYNIYIRFWVCERYSKLKVFKIFHSGSNNVWDYLR
jgi:hypothetical protein